MLRRILLHTTPYYILYKGEKLIYTEKFLLKLFFLYRQEAPDKTGYFISPEGFIQTLNYTFRKIYSNRKTLYQ